MGQIYVDVAAAQAEMGIMTMEASTGGGTSTNGAWLNWTESGYTGSGWYWDDPNNGLKAGWEKLIDSNGGLLDCGEIHDRSQESFLEHVVNRHAENLNSILGEWTTPEKTRFIVLNENALEGCVVWQ